MNYRINQKNGDKISALAFGFMRVGRDEKEINKYLISAIDNGLNYIDTAYLYQGNETILGRILQKGYREKVKIATKIPPFLVKKTTDFDKIFSTQLERLQTDYIDYYLIHMLPSASEWQRLENLGALDWIKAKKDKGAIKNIGFSYHGGFEKFTQIVAAYDWDFCQLQYNYFDENNQAGRKGIEYAIKQGLPIMVMEPLRGGTLANKLPKEAVAEFKVVNPEMSPAEWALRWLWNQPEVLTVLSGMTSQKMVDENIRAASNFKPGTLTKEELEAYVKTKQIILDSTNVGCTGCGYCMPCPQGVDIPMCFTCYNDIKIEGKSKGRLNYILRTTNHDASLCTKCGKCEKHCPQGIKIRAELEKTAKVMGVFPFALLYKLMRNFMRLNR